MLLFKFKATLIFILGTHHLALGQELGYERIETTVYFNHDSDELSSTAKTKIGNIFPFDSEFYPESITLTGYTDKSGNRDYNLKLSERRAFTVKNFISSSYIFNTEFNIQSIGEEQPAYGCDDNLNRCVKILMLLKEKEKPVSIERCKELFPEEFAISEKSIIPESEELLIPKKELTDDNKFQKKIVTSQKEMVRLNEILFYGNSDRYYKSAIPELNELAEFLELNKEYDITITGHVNGGKNSSRLLRKESEFNDIYDLSLARADAVKLYLIEKGISAERIESIGKGGEEMLFPKPQTTAESTANRRIEVTFNKKES